MDKLFLTIMNMSITSSIVILFVLVFRLFLKRTPKVFSYILWMVVLFRLLCPISFDSMLSFMPMDQKTTAVSQMAVRPSGNILERHALTYISKAPDGSLNEPAFAVTKKEHFDILDFLPVVCPAWCTGVFLMLGYSLYSLQKLKKLVAHAIRSKDNIYFADHLKTPFVLGIFRPRIYLPADLSEKEQRYILLHEQMHIKRKDPIVKILAYLALCIHWFNPLVWIAFLMMTQDMEMYCDESVLKQLGPSVKKEYSASLLNLAAGRQVISPTPLAFGEGNVAARVKNVLHYKRPAIWISFAAIFCVALLCTGLAANPKNPATAGPPNQDTELMPALSASSAKFYVDQWAAAFCGRDGKTIADMSSDEVKKLLQEKELLTMEADYSSFGFSSPWPMQENDAYTIRLLNDSSAVIYYYAMTSEPHAAVWMETIEYALLDESFKVTNEALAMFDAISTTSEFCTAYPEASFEGTGMDYRNNGLGNALNDNTLSSHSDYYQSLLAPDTAALYLLNIINDGSAACTIAGYEKNDTVQVSISFADGSKNIEITMIQPYGANGIWVPQSYEIADAPAIEQNDRYQELLRLFPAYHEFTNQDPIVEDLNGDGVFESITLNDLGMQGGDGGYEVVVESGRNQLTLPNGYTEQGYPFKAKWRSRTLSITLSDWEYILSDELIDAIYSMSFGTDELSRYKDIYGTMMADPVSGAVVINSGTDKQPVLVLKQYLYGPAGHANCIGYGITELVLKADNTWEEPVHYYLPGY